MQLLGHMNDVLFEPIVALGKGVEPSRSARIQRGSGIPKSQLDSISSSGVGLRDARRGQAIRAMGGRAGFRMRAESSTATRASG